jgi:hypothetical protein
MRQEEALLVIVGWLRDGSPGPRTEYSHYGYDLYIPTLIRWYLRSRPPRLDQFEEQRRTEELFSVFADAAWALCRRGIIRPGVHRHGAQVTDEGSGGSGFSVTTFGRKWLEEEEKDTFVPTEPERFAELLAQFHDRFGPGFHERGQEAVRCYGAHAYLACCAMCGAAAESVLLATAITKIGDEKEVLRAYATANGRTRIENRVIGQAPDHLKSEFRGLTELLKYWRDEAAHGKASQISDNEAYTSLAMLLRYAMFIHQNWSEFTIQA